MYANTYTGKYVAQKRRRRRRICTFLYVVNFLLLIVAAVRVFSGPDRTHAPGSIVTEAVAVTQPAHAVMQPTESVFRDVLAPVIDGVKDITIYVGETVSYRTGITVFDDTDLAVELTVDSSSVDLSKPGTYPVVYSATDSAGNTAQITATVTVLPMKTDYVKLETIYAAVDEVLDSIFWEGMTVREQVGAIYSWAHSNIRYAGHSDREDWRQTGYSVLQSRKGDCFGYFAVTKLMFERLGIPNIDVEKVKNSEKDSNHYWSLVSIDGGESYYHFDATPRVGQTVDFCLITDAMLDAYSEENKDSHNRDRSLYPATPEVLP